MSEVEERTLRLVADLIAQVDRLEAKLDRCLKKADSRELMSAHAVDKAFRLRRGTASKACAAGVIPCVKRERSGMRAWLIRAEDAEAQWGAK